MGELEILAPVKGTSWPSLIEQVDLQNEGELWREKGETDKGKPFPLDKAQSIRSAISFIIKGRYPDRIYKANKEVVSGIDVLIVRRVK